MKDIILKRMVKTHEFKRPTLLFKAAKSTLPFLTKEIESRLIGIETPLALTEESARLASNSKLNIGEVLKC